MRIKFNQRRLAILAAAAVVAGTFAAPAPAQANAHKQRGFGPCYVAKGICIPRGEMSIDTYSVGGSGRQIRSVSAGFVYIGQISNLWIDHDFFDRDGKQVRHLQGPKKWGNFSTNTQSWSWRTGYYLAPAYGTHCATLFSQEPGYVKTWKTVCNKIGG